jgi:inositol-pentakisphosphate 2-kinase
MHSHLRKVSQTTYCPLDLYSNDPTRVKDALHVLLTDATMKKTLKIDGYDAALNEIILNILMNDRILQILKHLQQKLDALDIEYIYPVYQHHGTLITDDIDVWKKVVAQFKLPADLNKEKEEIQRIYEYVLSMTFKDCSLMINAEKTQQVTKNTITLKDGSMYRYDIKVIDTDLKSIDKIPFWYQLDQSIINHAIDTQLVKNKRCIL